MNNEPHPRVYVAMRTIDRQQLISPSKLTPDVFMFRDINDKQLPLEHKVQGLMRTHVGVNVNSDHHLVLPFEHTESSAYSVYLRSLSTQALASTFGYFGPQEVRQAYRDMHDMSHEIDMFPENERREFKIKAALFQQVLNLFHGKSPEGGRRRV